MREKIFYRAGTSNALDCAIKILKEKGCRFSPVFDHSVTHLLLDVPHKSWDQLPESIGADVTVLGGNLHASVLADHKTVDLLQDPFYLAENANITAHCAITMTLPRLPVTLYQCPVLVIGWGRIGKCLAQLLKAMGAQVTVAARKASDRAMLAALGYDAIDIADMRDKLGHYRVIYNTVPVMVLSAAEMAHCSPDCLKIELASSPGMAGEGIIDARGLPNRGAPESSGNLIARSILRLC